MLEYIVAGCLTAAGIVKMWMAHRNRVSKRKAAYEKEKHYLRRDQRIRLKAAKQKAKDIREQKQIAAEKAATPDILPIIKNVIADINRED